MTDRSAALFDMDKTLVPVNTGSLFVKWRFSRGEARKRDVLRFFGWMAKYAVGTLDPRTISRDALSAMRGTSEAEFRDECLGWYREAVAPLISDDARREVERRRRDGDVLAVLSASTRYTVAPLAEDLGIEHVLCTELEVDADGRFTGDADLCFGPRKLQRAEAWAREHGVALHRSSFFTDSSSDLPVLLRVGEPRIVNPDPRLRALALIYDWPVERWD